MPARGVPVFVLGLDGATPELAFGRFQDRLPTLRALAAGGSHGPLRSVHPPITVPAWTSMLTGLDPGELGLYGFRSRADRGYAAPRLCDARDVHAPAVWDLAGRAGLDSIVVGHPQSYPVAPLRGCMVSGMLTPPGARETTWPPELAGEIARWVGDYRFDAEHHRSGERCALYAEVVEMTRRRFAVIRKLAATRPWRFFFAHEIGLDRLQHAFWDALGDPADPQHEVLLDYHRVLDEELGETLQTLPPETVVWVTSDHGARRLEGSFCINEWLIAAGHLRLRSAPSTPGPLDPASVDWARTRAWADGGYCGRLYLNVAGREPEGNVQPAAARALREELRCALEALRGPDGAHLASAVHAPGEVYARTRGVPPDLLVYPGDLRLRCAASVGHGRIFLDGNDAGFDAANHAWDGIFVRRDPEQAGAGYRAGTNLLDVAKSLLRDLGLPPADAMRGGSVA